MTEKSDPLWDEFRKSDKEKYPDEKKESCIACLYLNRFFKKGMFQWIYAALDGDQIKIELNFCPKCGNKLNKPRGGINPFGGGRL